MYISRLSLKNIRCFKDVDIDLTCKGKPRRWVTFVGDNGTGKTTLLRSLAVGLCDEAGGYSLLSELWGDFTRDNANGDSVIEVEVRHRGKPYTLTTKLGTSHAKDYQIEQPKKQLEAFPFDKRFVCAYGAGRGVRGSVEYDQYAVVDALTTLFDYDQKLQNPELAVRRWAGFDESKVDDVCRLLEFVLFDEGGEGTVKLRDTGFYVNGHPLHTAADGYQAVLLWILDLLAWVKLAKKSVTKNRFEGIVILDEIDQHLHPTWQRRIVSRLCDKFPKIQFITTTHSPLCAAGVADVNESDGYLGRLFEKDGAVVCEEISKMEGWRYDKVLTSEAFGVSDSRNIEVEELRRELHQLYNLNRPKPEQTRRIRQLVRELEKRTPGGIEADSLDTTTSKPLT